MKGLILVIILSGQLLLLSSFREDSMRQLAWSYIDRYEDIAREEMKRTGIPASIKLAQGMLESDLGRSPLATTANNHFGIKCGKDWQGGTFFKTDDDVDAEGNPIESCFRKFDQAEESYRAHSVFLYHPSKKKRYGFLFDLAPSDYTAWAHGLKSAGYATDPAYPAKLIRLIQEYELFIIDAEVLSEMPVKEISSETSSPEKAAAAQRDSGVIIQDTSKTTSVAPQRQHIMKKVKAKKGETLIDIARRTAIDVYSLLEWNEGIESTGLPLNDGALVYLERKKASPPADAPDYHVASGDESLFEISQKYGIRLQCLVDRNNIPENCMPVEGEKIRLRSSVPRLDIPKYKENTE